MAKYRKISPSIWNDARFLALSDDAQMVFLFLLTHPHQTSLGAMRASVPGLAAEKRWQMRRFERAFGEVLGQGMVRHDRDASFIWLPKFLRHNGPESPNVVRSWASSLEVLPECRLKTELIAGVQAYLEALPEAFREALPEAFAKSIANQEQEQEQEQESRVTPRPTRTKTTFPKDFTLSDELKTVATSLRLDPDREFEKFKNHHLSKGSAFADWSAAFRNWCVKADEFNSPRRNNGRYPSVVAVENKYANVGR